MEEKNKPNNKLVLILTIFILGAIAVLADIPNQQINLCRGVFRGLVKGSYSIQRHIDWENFKALGVDVGATYARLANAKEKDGYKRAFISSFSRGFIQSGSSLNSFTNWRVYNKDSEKIVIAADYLRYNKTLLFTIPRTNKRRLAEMQWEDTR